MLHFLLGLALCIFIGERLWHYATIIRLRRAERRYLAALYPPEPLQRASQFTHYEPEARDADRKALKISAAVFITAASFLAIAFLGH